MKHRSLRRLGPHAVMPLHDLVDASAQPLRIADASLIERVPPRLYGRTERVVSYLTEQLVALGHDVTLFASGDSATTARLVPCCRQALRLRRCSSWPRGLGRSQVFMPAICWSQTTPRWALLPSGFVCSPLD
jgi:hypothetical protein